MGIALGHMDMGWIMGGIVVFAGLMIFMIKLVRGHILSSALSVAVWIFVYKIHSGTNTGIMTATLAALLFDMLGLPLLRALRRR